MLVKRDASTRALRKVVDAVRVGSGNGSFSKASEYEDLFDEEERMKMSVDDD